MTLPNIPLMNAHIQRRNNLCEAVRKQSGTGVVILHTAPEKSRNRDSDFPYRYDSDFFYLTGFTEPDAVLVIQVFPDHDHSVIFVRPKNLEREIWDGFRLGPEMAPAVLGMNTAFSIEEISEKMVSLLENCEHLYYRMAASPQEDDDLRNWMQSITLKARSGIKRPKSFIDIESILHEMRLFKDDTEIDTMQQAASIAAQGHLAAMKACKPGKKEYHLEAELLYTFRHLGSQSVAYNSIVATGANACILHYRAGDTELKDGDLCLIDAGCELNGYASDITRTFPVNGKFSPAQKQVYEIVLAAQEAAIAQCLVGNTFQDPHDAALRVLTLGLFELGILHSSVHGTLENAIEIKAYQPYYMHRTSHWLGMDVHDVGSYREPEDPNLGWRTLRPGMVLTIEPGLYFRPAKEIPEKFWNIGIRIEDDVLIESSNPRILSRDVPVEVEAIEEWMASSSSTT